MNCVISKGTKDQQQMPGNDHKEQVSTLPGLVAFVTFIFTGILLLDDLLLIVSERNQSFPPLPNGYYQAKGTHKNSYLVVSKHKEEETVPTYMTPLL